MAAKKGARKGGKKAAKKGAKKGQRKAAKKRPSLVFGIAGKKRSRRSRRLSCF